MTPFERLILVVAKQWLNWKRWNDAVDKPGINELTDAIARAEQEYPEGPVWWTYKEGSGLAPGTYVASGTYWMWDGDRGWYTSHFYGWRLNRAEFTPSGMDGSLIYERVPDPRPESLREQTALLHQRIQQRAIRFRP